MTVTINLSPEKERALKAQAEADGVSLEEWLLRLAEREVRELSPSPRGFENLSDLLLASPFAGANLNLDRLQDYARPVEIE
jgi:hypothetical protein